MEKTMSDKEFKEYISHVRKLRENVTPKKAKAFLIKVGAITEACNLTKKYR